MNQIWVRIINFVSCPASLPQYQEWEEEDGKIWNERNILMSFRSELFLPSSPEELSHVVDDSNC
jgi:hypothetical protein